MRVISRAGFLQKGRRHNNNSLKGGTEGLGGGLGADAGVGAVVGVRFEDEGSKRNSGGWGRRFFSPLHAWG